MTMTMTSLRGVGRMAALAALVAFPLQASAQSLEEQFTPQLGPLAELADQINTPWSIREENGWAVIAVDGTAPGARLVHSTRVGSLEDSTLTIGMHIVLEPHGEAETMGGIVFDRFNNFHRYAAITSGGDVVVLEWHEDEGYKLSMRLGGAAKLDGTDRIEIVIKGGASYDIIVNDRKVGSMSHGRAISPAFGYALRGPGRFGIANFTSELAGPPSTLPPAPTL